MQALKIRKQQFCLKVTPNEKATTTYWKKKTKWWILFDIYLTTIFTDTYFKYDSRWGE